MRITKALRLDLQRHYGLRHDICNADALGEWSMLKRKGMDKIAGDERLEALLAIFNRHGFELQEGAPCRAE